MEWQTVINLGATAVVGAVGWFVRELHADLKQTRKDLADYKLEAAEKYATVVSVERLGDRLERKLDTFFEILHGKQDKA